MICNFTFSRQLSRFLIDLESNKLKNAVSQSHSHTTNALSTLNQPTSIHPPDPHNLSPQEKSNSQLMHCSLHFLPVPLPRSRKSHHSQEHTAGKHAHTWVIPESQERCELGF
jgi:hypothetical protein